MPSQISLTCLWSLLALLPLASSTSSAATIPAPTKSFLQKHCFECHDADTQKGKVRLDTLAADFASPAAAETLGARLRAA